MILTIILILNQKKRERFCHCQIFPNAVIIVFVTQSVTSVLLTFILSLVSLSHKRFSEGELPFLSPFPLLLFENKITCWFH